MGYRFLMVHCSFLGLFQETGKTLAFGHIGRVKPLEGTRIFNLKSGFLGFRDIWSYTMRVPIGTFRIPSLIPQPDIKCNVNFRIKTQHIKSRKWDDDSSYGDYSTKCDQSYIERKYIITLLIGQSDRPSADNLDRTAVDDKERLLTIQPDLINRGNILFHINQDSIRINATKWTLKCKRDSKKRMGMVKQLTGRSRKFFLSPYVFSTRDVGFGDELV